MRVVFMGTPAFAVPVLDALHERHEVVAVYSRADAVSGRGGKLRPCAVKERAAKLGLDTDTPGTLLDPDEVERLERLAPDCIAVASYGLLLPRAVLDIPRYGCLNVHPSLLPRWRGAAPIQRAILAGDTMTGVCVMHMEEGLDTGPFTSMTTCKLTGRYADEMFSELSRLGAAALLRAMVKCESDTVDWTAQDDARATYADKLTKHELRLDPECDAEGDMRKVLASSSSIPAKALICGKGVTVLRARRGQRELGCGRVSLDGSAVEIGYGADSLIIEMLKPDGGKAMDASAWAKGLHGPSLVWSRL